VTGVNTGFNDSLADVRKVIREADLGMPTVIDDGAVYNKDRRAVRRTAATSGHLHRCVAGAA
jgi:hypothetical protein